ncbi:FtsW/RodA/SpoVE family cell cycle protein [Lederbergia lenta]|uniref:Cell cycle protein n=1 Tax=Lederbergia lenta TaxID=1467 RepID=A0A2X4ZMN4_LEDLE|nr:FtsW/RodA/SpoVE family cell cycle protein [Lederbergia lenta]MCM3112987.1 rod shape-determining protein RodA [Lederbergia lenta]MEC2322713.1 FtsW/RodA/SpoVE family cell cycle protein [Lederbergia lenta]SQI61654.1 cell cycle protein [Lederbergia lenta]
MTSPKKPIPKLDYGIILSLMLLAIVSFITLYSAQSTGQYKANFVVSQAQWYVIGSIAIIFIIRFDSDQMKKISKYAYGFGMLLLVILLLLPVSKFTPIINGAKLWFVIPGVGQIQPSEFMKIATIMMLALVTSTHHERFLHKTIKTDFYLLIKISVIFGLPFMLTIIEDLGTSLVFVAIFLGIVFVSGITWKLLLPIFSFVTVIAGAAMYLAIWQRPFMEKFGVDPYQFKRIDSWLDPFSHRTDAGMQLVKSLLAIGSGQTSGKGFGSREVYMPESHSDFIFSTIGEEFGFVGGSIVISLFFMLIYQITKTGLDTKNPYYSYICVGVISLLTFHVFQNIGMTIQVLPITGIPLPFISYGGSSLLSNMIAMGIILSIRYHYKKYMFASEG